MIEIMNLIDAVIELTSHTKCSESIQVECISKLALALKMLVNIIKCEEGDSK